MPLFGKLESSLHAASKATTTTEKYIAVLAARARRPRGLVPSRDA